MLEDLLRAQEENSLICGITNPQNSAQSQQQVLVSKLVSAKLSERLEISQEKWEITFNSGFQYLGMHPKAVGTFGI